MLIGPYRSVHLYFQVDAVSSVIGIPDSIFDDNFLRAHYFDVSIK